MTINELEDILLETPQQILERSFLRTWDKIYNDFLSVYSTEGRNMYFEFVRNFPNNDVLRTMKEREYNETFTKFVDEDIQRRKLLII